ncbi:MAG: resolvase [Lachnospiraceae bacterium]|jgi:DNA invertase Pin-like site-specific DNA recombinase|nr:resolvase [Lachnospiraceae bacterium]MDF2843449.1 resolvase [Herbinix sp.]
MTVLAGERVSSSYQNLDRQLDAFKKMGANERDIITDKVSGKDFDRPGYLALKNAMLRSGDTLVVKSIDRLSRRKDQIKTELQWFKENKIRLMVIDLPTTMVELPEGHEWISDMINNILIEVLSSIAEQEHITTRQRQREGIDAAKSRGKHLGRPRIDYPNGWESIYNEWKSRNITAKEAMNKLLLKRNTFYVLAKQWENK